MHSHQVQPIQLDNNEAVQPVTGSSQQKDSSITSSALMLQKLECDLATLNTIGVNSLSSSSTNSASDFPDESDDDITPPDGFDSNVPDDYEHPSSYPSDGKGIMEKLQWMISWMKSNPSSKKGMAIFIQFVANLCNKTVNIGGKTESLLTAYPKLVDYIKGLKDSTGESIVSKIVDVLIEEKYYESKSSDESAFFTELTQTMFGGDDAISQQIRARVNHWSMMWSEFVDSHCKKDKDGKLLPDQPDMEYSDFQLQATKMWGDFMLNCNSSKTGHDILMDEVDDLIKQYKDNPLMLVMMLVFMISDSSSSSEISGYGSTSSWMSKRTDDVTQILTDWTTGPQSQDDATKFMDEIKALLAKIDTDPRAADIKDQIDSQFGTIFSQTAVGSDGKPLTDPTDPTRQLTISDLYNGYTNSKGTKVDPDPGKLLTSLKQFQPSSGSSAAVPTQYQTILNAIKSGSSCVTDQSQTITTEISQKSSSMQANENMINKYLNEDSGIIGMEKVAVQNQKTS